MTELAPQALSPHHTALRCLFVIALQRGIVLKPEDFAGFTDRIIVDAVLRVMAQVGLSGRVIKGCRVGRLTSFRDACPFMVLMKDGHWAVVTGTSEGGLSPTISLLDPRSERDGSVALSRRQFSSVWAGTVILCRKSQPETRSEQSFGIAWFVPEILRHRSYLRDVTLAAIMSSFIAFAMPLLFQVLIDKVIGHKSYQTLATIVLIVCTLTVFDAVFNYMRQYAMLFITSKIDARFASSVFQHLLSLPLPFFESTTAGILSRHPQQTETIRHFLTGRLFQTALDAVSLPLTLTILLLYSLPLTAVVLAFAATIAALIALVVPTFRRQLEQLYRAEGARQGHLVETLHGMRTVKSLSLEPIRLAGWNEAVAQGVLRRSSVGKISALANILTQAIEKLMQLSVLAIGAMSVFEGTLSIGALVAFNMISGRVSGPLVQFVGLVNEYQEVSLAVKMLGSIMSHPPERQQARGALAPDVTGDLRFESVTFRYPGSSQPALDGLSFEVPRGKVIGIVGRSGSGKTTLTRLIQGIQSPQDGMIKVDGIDLRNIDLTHLRRSIGVVLQESFLFRGTIRDNIAAARPDLPLEDVTEAARMAGAAEFIERLPAGYDTLIEENGANFSGGQRQRIAIARALVTRPRLLIFDEATSALDPESEAVVQAHLADIADGRTLIIVSHRLTSLVGADAILVLDNGALVDFAPHGILLQRCEVYQKLWLQQTSHFL